MEHFLIFPRVPCTLLYWDSTFTVGNVSGSLLYSPFSDLECDTLVGLYKHVWIWLAILLLCWIYLLYAYTIYDTLQLIAAWWCVFVHIYVLAMHKLMNVECGDDGPEAQDGRELFTCLQIRRWVLENDAVFKLESNPLCVLTQTESNKQ